MSLDTSKRKSPRRGESSFSQLRIEEFDDECANLAKNWSSATKVFLLLIIGAVIFAIIFSFYKIFGSDTLTKISAIIGSIVILAYVLFLIYDSIYGIL